MRNKLISLNLALVFILSLFPCSVLTAKAVDDDFGYATYYFNDGTEGSQSVQIGIFLASNCNLTMYEALKRVTPSYANHVLTGFSSSADGGTAYGTGDIIKNIFTTDSSNPGIIYAQWENIDGDYVVYRCSDGTTEGGKNYIVSSITPGEITLDDGSAFTNSDGKIVVTWVTGSGPDQRRYAPGSAVNVESGTEFMAVMGINYIVFHDGNQETWRPYTVSDTPILEVGRSQPTKVFSGWNTKQDGTGDWYYPLSEANDVPHHLYAQYVELPESDFVVLTNDLGFEDGPMAKVESLGSSPITLPQQVKGQQAVAYWHSYSGKYYPAGIPVTVESGERLEAQATLPGSYYGVIDGVGGLTAQKSPYYATACYVTSAGNLNLYSFNDLVAFTKDGAAVSGYRGSKTGTVYSFSDDIWAAMGAEAESNNIANFTAQYEELTGSYIQYMGNGASTADNKSYIIQSDLDFSNLNGAAYAQNPFEAPAGKHFLGWNTAQNGRGDWYDSGDTITLTANTVLYAQWGASRITYHYTDFRGQPAKETVVNGANIMGGMSDIESASESDVYALAQSYGLRNYLRQDSSNNYITRLDAAKLIVNLGNLNVDTSNSSLSFVDCDGLSLEDRAIVKSGVDAGLLSGTSSDRFSPDSIVARAQMMAMIWRFLGGKDPTQPSGNFSDVPVSAWYYLVVESMLESGVIITDRGTFEPDAPATFLDAYRWATAAHEVKEFGSVQNGDKLKDSVSQTLFEGWTTENNHTGSWYIPGDKISDGTVADLYENWISTPTAQYCYVLTGRKMDNGRYTKIIELDNRTESVTLPLDISPYGWFGGGLSLLDITGRRGFIDETENFFASGEIITVATGDVFRPLSGIFASYHKNDGSAAATRIYYYIASNASLKLLGVDEVFQDLPTGKTFTSWNTDAGGSGHSYTANTSVQDSLQLFAQWKDSSSSSSGGNSGGTSSTGGGSSFGGGGGGTTTTTPTVTTGTTTGGGSTIKETTASPTASIQGTKAATTVNASIGNEIVKQAVANKSDNVVIAPKITGNVTKAEVSIPATTVGQIGSQTNASLTVSTPVADATIPNSALATLSSAGSQVNVTAERTDKGVELSVKAGGKTIESLPGGVTLTIPVASATPGTVAVLIHEDGTREVVRKSVAEGDSVTIPLDGSAKLEIVDNSKTFSDVTADHWAANAVAFVSAHELFNGTGSGEFSPNLPMSRGMLAVVLHNLESNPDQALTDRFTDVNSENWYAEGIAWAAANSIVGGYGNGQFGPNDSITREQLAVMLWRYAGSPVPSNLLLQFVDADAISGYASDAMRWAVDQGILSGYGNGRLGPQDHASRAQVAQMLKNYLER